MGSSNSHRIINNLLALAALVLIAVLLSWVAVHWDLDRKLSGVFYSPDNGWHLKNRIPWKWLYQYGEIPGLLLAFSALGTWFIVAGKPRKRQLRRACLVIFLATVIGPGLIVNGVLKNYWGRPRPRHVDTFGGNWEYRHVYQPGIPQKGESFPCGHCSMGFIFCSLLVLRRQYPKLAVTGTAAGVLMGTALGFARVVQGAHFPTDVLWSFTVVAGVILLLDTFIPMPDAHAALRPRRRAGRAGKWLPAVAIAAAILLTVGFLLHQPFYEDHRLQLVLPPSVRQIVLSTDVHPEKVDVRFTDNRLPAIVLEAKGFAWPGASHRLVSHVKKPEDGIVEARLTVVKKGYFTELTHEISIFLPKALENTIDVKIIDPVVPKKYHEGVGE
ncbi:MAG: phosphatase PAP2 family protein [Deltaproteobacteria bacterium]|nr:phosphatase PAP2 family protein [Deltaproteobacteria bacterium]